MRDKTTGFIGASILLAAVVGCSPGDISSSLCSNHGATLDDGACDCDEGYTGYICDSCVAGYQDNDHNGTCSPDCQSLNLSCDPPLQCVDFSGTAECNCPEGYGGDACDQCDVNFQDNDGNNTCEPACSHPYYGCSGHGTCVDSSGTVVCTCETGYGGEHCDSCASQYQDNDGDGVCTLSCAGGACNHGDCDDSTGTAVCDCDEHYTGDNCTECTSGYQDNDQDGECLATCATAGYTCSGHGDCVDTSGVARCDCDDGYADDGAGNCTSASYIVTYVNDGLDRNDGEIMEAGLTALGFTEMDVNTNVSSSALIGYLQSNATVLYHTGHGDDGLVWTANNGTIVTSSTTINVVNTIFATCLTLKDVNWKNQMNASAQNIFGYTKESLDYVDDDIANDYLDALGAGRSHLQAWYLSNSSNSNLDDRWCAYSRVGGSIVEYSARTGNNPPMSKVGRWVTVGGNLRIDEALLSDDFDYSKSFTGYQITRDERPFSTVEPGDMTSWLQPTKMSEAEAIDIAAGYLAAQRLLPVDAVVGEVIAIEVAPDDDESDPPAIGGYTVRFEREIGGLPIRGNEVADQVTALVADGRVVAATRYWPELAGQSGREQPQLLTVAEAIDIAALEISRSLKSYIQTDIVAAVPVYGTSGPGRTVALRPAYQFLSSDGLGFVVDAETGHLLK